MAGTPERLTAETFATAQAENLLAAAFAIPEEDVRTCLRDPTTMIGSDAILTDGNNHPRATGCFARTLGRYARDQKTISLMDALAKMTILPARWLQPKAPALARKGRLQRGADADITVFDPDTVIDRSTVAEPRQFSAGIEWVLIGGQVVKTPEAVDTNDPRRQADRVEPDLTRRPALLGVEARARTSGGAPRTRPRRAPRCSSDPSIRLTRCRLNTMALDDIRGPSAATRAWRQLSLKKAWTRYSATSGSTSSVQWNSAVDSAIGRQSAGRRRTGRTPRRGRGRRTTVVDDVRDGSSATVARTCSA